MSETDYYEEEIMLQIQKILQCEKEKIWNGLWEMGSQKLEIRILNTSIPFPISKSRHLKKKIELGPGC